MADFIDLGDGQIARKDKIISVERVSSRDAYLHSLNDDDDNSIEPKSKVTVSANRKNHVIYSSREPVDIQPELMGD